MIATAISSAASCLKGLSACVQARPDLAESGPRPEPVRSHQIQARCPFFGDAGLDEAREQEKADAIGRLVEAVWTKLHSTPGHYIVRICDAAGAPVPGLVHLSVDFIYYVEPAAEHAFRDAIAKLARSIAGDVGVSGSYVIYTDSSTCSHFTCCMYADAEAWVVDFHYEGGGGEARVRNLAMLVALVEASCPPGIDVAYSNPASVEPW
jgi:hypothetical protein